MPRRAVSYVVALLVLSTCSACLLPSDPAGGFASRRNGSGVSEVIFPSCPDRPLRLLNIEVRGIDDEGRAGLLIWKLVARTRQPAQQVYALGATPDGYTATGEWPATDLPRTVLIEANFEQGLQLTNTATYSAFEVDQMYIEDRPAGDGQLQQQIYCS